MLKHIKISVLAILLAIAVVFSVGCQAVPNEATDDTEGTSFQSDSQASTDIATQKPSDDTQKPSGDTQKPSGDTQKPSGDTQKPDIEIDDAQALRDKFYGDSDPADSREEAISRSVRGELSGAETVPDQAPTLSQYLPKIDGKYLRNNEPYYLDENTYVVVDALGREIFRVYRGGGYITLEEVAAYLYAFGDVPANYTSSKSTKPSGNIWGKNLRVNHTRFSGDTSKYPYEPVLPRISGCGGDLYYYELDIGTTGTDCDPSYPAKLYNNGTKITRGAARIVYTRFDANNDSIIDPNEKFLFYTYNHYNDFQEYLNYFGGWGEMFGNITGGGSISSKTDYNPTAYVPVVMGSLKAESTARSASTSCVLAIILPEYMYGEKKYA